MGQVECLSPFLFSMFVNVIEYLIYVIGVEGVDITLLKLFLLFYSNEITIFSETFEGFQKRQYIYQGYCSK